LADLGLNYVAATQDAAITRKRIGSASACWIALQDHKLVGTICYYASHRYESEPDWYRRDDVCHFGQFAVEPLLQGSGIGSALLRLVERRAVADKKLELACDTAEPAAHLLDYYQRRGFRVVGHHRWPHARYTSVILSKRLGATTELSEP
jgi:GNAT superfamily N-acetyltransferase